MNDLVDALRHSWLGVIMRETPDLFPAMEMAHFVGLSLLMGAMIAIDLRILGVLRKVSFEAVFKLIPMALLGFAINMISGICFICTNPALYLTNKAFYAKIILIMLGGLNALWFTLAEQRKLAGLQNEAAAPNEAKVMAAASLAMWVLVILLGRLLPTFANTGGG